MRRAPQHSGTGAALARETLYQLRIMLGPTSTALCGGSAGATLSFAAWEGGDPSGA